MSLMKALLITHFTCTVRSMHSLSNSLQHSANANVIADMKSKNIVSCSIQNLPWQSENAEAFAKAYLCFLGSVSAKKC